MDTFVEQIVVKRKDGKDMAIIAGLCVGMLVLVYICLLLLGFIGMLSFLLLIGGGFGAWRLMTSRNIEFEYSVTNGDIDIDTIISQRKRKRIVSVSGGKIETLEPYSEQIYAGRHFDRKVVAAPSLREEELWCFTYRSKKSGHTLVVFWPEDRVLHALVQGLQPLVQREVKKKLPAKRTEPAEADESAAEDLPDADEAADIAETAESDE